MRQGKSFGSIAFTDAVKALQEKAGSRASYARMEKNSYVDGLTENEMAFIAGRDSFYMASIGANDFPYIQHRGGPVGFLKVLDKNRISCVDFKGNMQFISLGNFATNNNVALIMVDYPTRTRLKILAKVEEVENATPKHERMLIFYIEAYDWNCPQYITPRYTLAEIEAAL